MSAENLIFSIPENRDLFRSSLFIGKKIKIKKYKEFFKNKDLIKVLNDPTVNETVDSFTKGDLNISVTSSNSYVHRNTLIYRINKVNATIGLDFRKFEDCLIYLNMREVYKMVKKHDV
jgi:sugar diacid utilization regulator